MGTRSARCAVTTAVVAVHQPRAGGRSNVHQIHLRRGNLDMNARCADVAAATAPLLLLPLSHFSIERDSPAQAQS